MTSGLAWLELYINFTPLEMFERIFKKIYIIYEIPYPKTMSVFSYLISFTLSAILVEKYYSFLLWLDLILLLCQL